MITWHVICVEGKITVYLCFLCMCNTLVTGGHHSFIVSETGAQYLGRRCFRGSLRHGGCLCLKDNLEVKIACFSVEQLSALTSISSVRSLIIVHCWGYLQLDCFDVLSLLQSRHEDSSYSCLQLLRVKAFISLIVSLCSCLPGM